MSGVGSRYTANEIWLFLDGPRLIDGSDLNHNFELLFYPQSSTVIITPGTTSYIVKPRDFTLLINTTSSDVNIFLLPCQNFQQTMLNIKKNDTSANKVIVRPSAGQTIEKAATTNDPFYMTQPLQTVTLCSDFSSNWPILGT